MSRSSKVPGARKTPSARQLPDHPPLSPLIEVPVESNPEDYITPENSPPSSTATPLSSSVFGSGSLQSILLTLLTDLHQSYHPDLHSEIRF